MLKLCENPPVAPEGIEHVADLAGDWWVAHTRPRAEKALAWDLVASSIAYFLPMSRRTAFWGGRKRAVLTPLFPSYVFCCGDDDDRRRVLATNRVCQTIAVHQRAQFVAELSAIWRTMKTECHLALYPYIAVGRRCRVVRGPLRGIEGVIIRIDGVTRLVLQVSMLGQGVSLEVPADFLQSAD